jgi:DNA-binding HxlR family transcriptional regulator
MVPSHKSRSGPTPENSELSECLQLLAGAWTPNVIWYLRQGPRRFSELRQELPGISAKLLTTRLRQLEHSGVLMREPRPTSPPTVAYALSELGKELLPAIEALVKVGNRLKQKHPERLSVKVTQAEKA